jgi:hypothetical protein
VLLFHFAGEQSGEDGIPGKSRGSGQNRVISRLLLNVEVIQNDGLNDFPLVVAKVVDEQEEQRISFTRGNTFFFMSWCDRMGLSPFGSFSQSS